MKMARLLALAAALSILAWISVALVVAQTVRIDGSRFFRIGGRQVIRLWQDFDLRQNETVRDVLVIAGRTTIAGLVDGDVIAVVGPVRVEGTATIRGSLVVVAGDVDVMEGATVRRDFIVIGGAAVLPPSFVAGGEHVAIGNTWLSGRVRAVVPWITYGLLWGRPLVPSLGWVWWFVAISLVLTLAVNLILHGPVGRSADTLAARPASAFLTGLLMLLLTGPLAVLLAATVIGLAVVPFFLCAVVVAWVVGKVGVSRWIGRNILSHDPEETPLQAMSAVLAGFAALTVLYAVPLVGFVTWAIVGVLGLGTATLTVLGALRRERATARPPAAIPPATAGVPADVSLDESGVIPPVPPPPPLPPAAPAASWAAAPAPPFMAAPSTGDEAGPPPPPPPPPSAPRGAAGLTGMSRATFLDRVAAGAIDVLFVAFVFNVFLARHVWRDGEWQLFLLLAYFITFWAWKATTLGGIVCNLRVVRLNGAPPAGADAIVRGLASLFSFVPFGLGFFWILRDPERQAWHDKIAGTLVVKVPRDHPL